MPPLIYEDLVIIGPVGNEAVVKGMGGSFEPDPVDQMHGWLTAIDAALGTV